MRLNSRYFEIISPAKLHTMHNDCFSLPFKLIVESMTPALTTLHVAKHQLCLQIAVMSQVVK